MGQHHLGQLAPDDDSCHPSEYAINSLIHNQTISQIASVNLKLLLKSESLLIKIESSEVRPSSVLDNPPRSNTVQISLRGLL